MPDGAARTREIYSLDMGALLAGTKFRGEFEQRLKGVIKALAGAAERDPVHRRDPHHRRRRRDQRRLDGRLEHPQAGARRRASCAASARRRTRSTRQRSSATARWRAASRRSRSASRRVEETVEILKGLQDAATRSTTSVDVHRRGDRSRRPSSSAKYINDRLLPDKAIDVHRRGGRARPAARRRTTRTDASTSHDVEQVVAKMAQHPGEDACRRPTSDALQNLEPRAASASSSARTTRSSSSSAAIKLSRSGLAHAGQADRLVPVLRPDRRRQDRAGQAAGARCWASSSSAST